MARPRPNVHPTDCAPPPPVRPDPFSPPAPGDADQDAPAPAAAEPDENMTFVDLRDEPPAPDADEVTDAELLAWLGVEDDAPAVERRAPQRASLLLGARGEARQGRAPIGFGSPAPTESGDLWWDESEAHGLVVAPTGSGKTTWLACQLARHEGSVVVFDPKGELTAMTARRRAELGNDVVVLDPFGVTDVGVRRGALDPIDVLRRSASLEDDAMSLAADLQPLGKTREPFWPQTAADLTAGAIIHAGRHPKRDDRSWDTVVSLLFDDDTDYKVAVLLDTGEVKDPTAAAAFRSYLGNPEQNTRPSVLSTARAGLRAFKSPAVRTAMAKTTFSLDGFVDGTAPATIYIVLPPQYVESHGAVVRLWVGALLQALTSPRGVARGETRDDVLFLLDELPALGAMSLVPSLYAYMRSFGIRTVSIVQSLAQLQACYGDKARVIRENAGMRMAFGVTDQAQADDVAPMLDTAPDRVLDLARDEALVRIGRDTVRCRRANHLRPEFVPEGWFDPNPFHAKGSARGPER